MALRTAGSMNISKFVEMSWKSMHQTYCERQEKRRFLRYVQKSKHLCEEDTNVVFSWVIQDDVYLQSRVNISHWIQRKSICLMDLLNSCHNP